MTDFAINPPIQILGRRGIFVRSTDQAAAFVREEMLRYSDSEAVEVLRRLEEVDSAEDAQDAAKVFRAWIANVMHAGVSRTSKRGPPDGGEQAPGTRSRMRSS